jgi:NF-kappa-B inhibitor-like protein 1
VPYAALPWPGDPSDHLSTEQLKALLLQGCGSAADVKKRLKLELMRWHPDKFTAKYLGRVVEKDRGQVVAGVQAVAQCLTALLGAAQQ